MGSSKSGMVYVTVTTGMLKAPMLPTLAVYVCSPLGSAPSASSMVRPVWAWAAAAVSRVSVSTVSARTDRLAIERSIVPPEV